MIRGTIASQGIFVDYIKVSLTLIKGILLPRKAMVISSTPHTYTRDVLRYR